MHGPIDNREPVAATPILGEPLIDAEAASQPVPPPGLTAPARLLLGCSLVLIGFNLRPVFSSLAALLPEVMVGTGAGTTLASFMTTLPILCLGLFSPVAPRLAQRIGAERVILGALVAIAAGTGLRGFGTVPALMIGACLAGAAIAIVNVLLPGLVKRDFPDRIAAMTGLYSMALSGGAAAAAGLTVPIELRLGGSWAAALAAWAVPAAAVALLWAPQALGARPPPSRAGTAPRRSLLKDPLAWQVSLFMGLQSALVYCVFGWLAPILRDHGLDAASAGYVVSGSVFAQMVGCLLAPPLAGLRRDQRLIGLVLWTMALAGILGCFYGSPRIVWGSALVLGLGQGGLIGVALAQILWRAPNAAVAARLSGMAQGIGYTLASGGPLLVGLLRQTFGGFAPVPLLFIGIALAGMAAGLGAGRDRLVRE